jgi:hypothetical protein
MKKVIVITTHLRRDRSKRSTVDILQPINGLHIGSLLDQSRYRVTLHNEDLHAPYDTSQSSEYDLVFLSGLQADLDRMRQLSYHFRRQGAVVIAGGSICTLFPEFASRFFDVVCAGGVECVLDFMQDYERGEYKKIYHSPQKLIRPYQLDYSLLTRNGIHSPVHLIEASRGCSYQCKFCALPAEGAYHAPYEFEHIKESIRSSIATSPRFSLRRNYPIIWFVDNNFTNNPEHLEKLCEYLGKERTVRAWGALATQNVLEDRSLIRYMRKSKCRVIFTGLESLDEAFLEAQNKRQNMAAGNIIDDIRFAQRQGMAILYAYIFDPRLSSVADMDAQLDRLLSVSTVPMSTFFSFLSPLVGTQLFWECYANGELLPNLRLRDLDGETVAFSKLADQPDRVADFARMLCSGLHNRFSSSHLLKSTLKCIIDSRTLHPFFWWVFLSTNFRAISLAKAYQRGDERTYIGGTDLLDPQYGEYPATISEEDYNTYFAPIQVLQEDGRIADWLKPYAPSYAVEKEIGSEADLKAGTVEEVHERVKDGVLIN